jgi:hypothetical protein
VPYATDGTDFRGALRYHYFQALKRFAKYAAIFAPMFVLMYATGIGYLLPLGVVGIVGFGIAVIFFSSAVSWTWKCSRIFHRYPLELRDPIEKLELGRNGTLVLGFGQSSADGASEFSARDPLSRTGWPEGIANGVWFAGDEVFGGAAVVPGTGELLFMQPRDWALMSGQREKAGTERTKRARRAGIKRRVTIR